MFVIFALKEDSNPGAMGKTGAEQMFPLALFFLIFGLGTCLRYFTISLLHSMPIPGLFLRESVLTCSWRKW
jgi:hypothetical protein